MSLKTHLESERNERLDQLRSHFALIAMKRKSAQDTLAKLDAEEKGVEAAYARAEEPLSGSVCVRCWVLDGEKIELTPQASDVSTVDVYSCPRCGEQVEVEVD